MMNHIQNFMITKDTQLGFEDGRIEDVIISVHSELHGFGNVRIWNPKPRENLDCETNISQAGEKSEAGRAPYFKCVLVGSTGQHLRPSKTVPKPTRAVKKRTEGSKSRCIYEQNLKPARAVVFSRAHHVSTCFPISS